MITAILVAALVQTAAINNQRDAFMACLKSAEESAMTQKMPPDALEAHLRQTCAAAEAKLTASLMAFDLKNNVARKRAAADAKMQIDDFVNGSVEHYKKVLALNERG
jgi:hypothetical protein